MVILKNFQAEKIPKENASYKCLLLIMLDSGTRVNKKHYLEIMLEECKYEIKNNKMQNQINDDFDSIHVKLNLIMNLIKNLMMDRIMNLTLMNLMINFLINLKTKTAF